MGIFRSFLAVTFLFAPVAHSKTITVRMSDVPVVLDWNTQSTMTEAPIILNSQEGLFRYNYATGKLIPGIASDVKKSKDLTEYTFTIRKDAKWSDGRPIYAQDFVYGWSRAFSPQSTSIYTYYFFDIEHAQDYNQKKVNSLDAVGIKAVNDSTLVVKLKRPHANWEVKTAFWSFFPARKDLIEKFGSNWWRPGVIVSSGPFVIDSYEAGKKMVFKRNKNYPANSSNVDELVFKFTSNFNEALSDYDSKKTDILNSIPYTELSKLEKRKDTISIPLMRVYAFGLNADRFPLSNKKFRLALLKSIDRKKLMPSGKSRLQFTDSMIAPPLEGSASAIPLTFNLKEAKTLLKESGVVLTKKLKVQLITGQQEPSLTFAKNIQNQVSQNLGINVEINAVSGEEYTTYMNLGEYGGFLTTWTAKIKNAADFLLPYSGFALNNRGHFFNSTFDDLIERAMEVSSPRDQSKFITKAQKMITEDEGMIIPLCLEQPYVLIHSTIKNVNFDQMGVPHLLNAIVQ